MMRKLFLTLLPAIAFAQFELDRLSLTLAEEIALTHNQQFLIAKETTYQAHERTGQAISKWLPAVHLRAEFRQIEQKELFFNIFATQLPFSHQGYSTIFEMNQPIFSSELLFGLKSNQLQEKAIRFEEAQTKNALLKAIRDNYYAVVASQISLEINRENVDYLTYALQKEEDRLVAGASTPFEVNQSKTAVANAISEYYTALKTLKNTRNYLILNLGVDPLLEPTMQLTQSRVPFLSIPELALKIHETQEKYHYQIGRFSSADDFTRHIQTIDKARHLALFNDQEVAHYLDIALAKRPDLAGKEMQMGVAEQHLRSKQGTYLPKILGYARYSYNDVTMGSTPFFDQKFYGSCGITLTWNLFDSMLREQEISEARSQRSVSKLQYTQELQRVEVEIRNGLYQLEEAIFTYLSSNEAVMLAEQARLQAQEKLEYGRISTLEYRDSVNQLWQAKNLRNKASFDLIAAYYEVRYATGVDAEI
ncbi:MAG TPA: TolC family protein [Chlamydiales bacterium]|jgi:outer membrane protein TolC